LCLAAKRDPGNLTILNFFLCFKIILFLKKYIEIVFGCEARPSTFDNFKFLSLLQNDFFKKNILRLCPAAKRDPRNLTILNLSLLQNNFFFKIYIDIVSGCEARPRKFENFKFFYLLQINILM